MKRLSVILVVILVLGTFSGCRFAVVESDSIRVAGMSAMAESSEGEALFDTEAADAGESSAQTVIGLHSRDEEGESKVRRLQQRLVDLGYLNVEPDGVFGSKTLKALKRFQHDNGLRQTGVLDQPTEAMLYPVPDVTTAPDDVLYSQGSSGSAVMTIQKMLRLYGFSARPVTGQYDEYTADEVRAFQEYAVENYGTEFDDPIAEELPAEPMLLANDSFAPETTPSPETAVETAIPEMPVLAPASTLRPYHAVDGVVSENLYNYLLANRFPVYRRTVQRGEEGIEVTRLQNRLSTLDYFYEDVDSVFGDATVQALKSFQARNGLQQTGIADAETQQRLYSGAAVEAEQVEMPYYIKVSINDQRVYIYRWSDGGYNQLIKTMICSTGWGNTTPTGVFVSPGQRDERWHYFAAFHCWAQYAFVIKGNILFHSVIFSRKDEASIRQSTVNNLGRKASHGCVRLMVEDARWIYEHCGEGQVIEIY